LVSLDLTRHVFVAALAAIFLGLIATAKQQPVVSLSSDPSGLTVESQKTGKKLIPGIDIYLDGAVAVRRYDGSEAHKRIDRNAVENLVNALERTRFYLVTEDTFYKEIDKSQRPGEAERIIITDCPTWTLRIIDSSIVRSARFYGLWDKAELYPKSKELKKLKDAFLMVYSAVGEKPF
jgi:hypothetical protein